MTAIDPAAVRSLPAKAQRELLDTLLTELGAHGVMQLTGPTGTEYVYRAPPNAKELAEEAARNAPPEELDELQRRARSGPEEWMNFDEALKLGEESIARPPTPQPASSATAAARKTG
jgi:hypothetical protein